MNTKPKPRRGCMYHHIAGFDPETGQPIWHRGFPAYCEDAKCRANYEAMQKHKREIELFRRLNK
jgi:hypothetical protein